MVWKLCMVVTAFSRSVFFHHHDDVVVVGMRTRAYTYVTYTSLLYFKNIFHLLGYV